MTFFAWRGFDLYVSRQQVGWIAIVGGKWIWQALTVEALNLPGSTKRNASTKENAKRSLRAYVECRLKKQKRAGEGE